MHPWPKIIKDELDYKKCFPIKHEAIQNFQIKVPWTQIHSSLWLELQLMFIFIPALPLIKTKKNTGS